MKKLYTLLCALILGASTTLLAAPVTNTTTSTDYDDLAAAIAAVAADQTLTLNENVTISARINTPTGIAFTIEGNNKTITMATNNSLNLNCAGDVTIKNVTFDATGCSNSNSYLNASGSGYWVRLENVTFANCATTSTQGIVCAKSNGKFAINNVTVESSCSVPEGTGHFYNGQADSQIKGNNSCTFLLNKRIRVMGELTNEAALTAYIDSPTVGTTYLIGEPNNDGYTEDAANWLAKFTCGTVGYKFEKSSNSSKKNEAVLAEDQESGISDVAAASEAVVNVYNMQGMVVRANVSSAAAAEGLAPGLYIMAGKKVLVR